MRQHPGEHLLEEKGSLANGCLVSRTRRKVECPFGTVYWKTNGGCTGALGVSPKVEDYVVKSTCILNNFLHWD